MGKPVQVRANRPVLPTPLYSLPILGELRSNGRSVKHVGNPFPLCLVYQAHSRQAPSPCAYDACSQRAGWFRTLPLVSDPAINILTRGRNVRSSNGLSVPRVRDSLSPPACSLVIAGRVVGGQAGSPRARLGDHHLTSRSRRHTGCADGRPVGRCQTTPQNRLKPSESPCKRLQMGGKCRDRSSPSLYTTYMDDMHVRIAESKCRGRRNSAARRR